MTWIDAAALVVALTGFLVIGIQWLGSRPRLPDRGTADEGAGT